MKSAFRTRDFAFSLRTGNDQSITCDDQDDEISIAKSIFNSLLTDRIAKMEESLIGYRALDHDLYQIKILIQRERALTAAHCALFDQALERRRLLIGQVIETSEDLKLKKNCQEEIAAELPTSSFFIPEH